MNPTYIETAIYRPGVKLVGDQDENRFVFGDLFNNDVATMADVFGGRIYSVTRNKMIDEGDEAVDAEDKLTETLFVIKGMVEVRPMVGEDETPWLVNFMSEGCYGDLNESNMLAIYKVVTALLDGKENDKFVSYVSFVGDWNIHTSRGGFDDLYPEIDAIEFAGACDIKLREETP